MPRYRSPVLTETTLWTSLGFQRSTFERNASKTWAAKELVRVWKHRIWRGSWRCFKKGRFLSGNYAREFLRKIAQNFCEKLAGDLHSQRATASISSPSEEAISQEYSAEFRR
jgi:hypothetical protein